MYTGTSSLLIDTISELLGSSPPDKPVGPLLLLCPLVPFSVAPTRLDAVIRRTDLNGVYALAALCWLGIDSRCRLWREEIQ
jgi:hypothetical protein